MRLLILLLVFLAGYTAAGAAQEIDDAAIEINPHDFVPLEVGNRWTYKHFYWNDSYPEGDGWIDIEVLKFLEIPGYPHGWENPMPPDSLTSVYRILTIEITHTEIIDGLEYFVFSDADYTWPPLPDLFWGGKKVRLSAEGSLVFRWDEQDLPVYDFGDLKNGYTVTLPGESGMAYFHFSRGMMFYEVPSTSNQLSLVHFTFSSSLADPRWYSCYFLHGYGVDQFDFSVPSSLSLYVPIFEVIFTPISATISGEEILYERLNPDLPPQEPESPPVVWGQLDRIDDAREVGFDFSEGTFGRFLGPDKEDLSVNQITDHHDGSAYDLPGLLSHIGMADLGRVDFGRLVSEGPADLRPDPPTYSDPLFWSKKLQEGNTYAFWTQEGGIALMHVLDVVLVDETRGRGGRWGGVSWGGGQRVDYILFDWVYYPDPDRSPDTTPVQPTSWGQLKQLFLQDSPIRSEE